jgi:hypothetical protein
MVPAPAPFVPATFEDFCLVMYLLVDEVWPEIAPRCRRPGPAPACSDQELVAMALIGEAQGWDEETVFVSQWSRHRDLFPRQPERSRLNRRRRQLQGAINEVRRRLLARLDLALDRQVVLDSLPVPVIGWHLVPDGARGYWEGHAARIGYVASKKQWLCGYKPYLPVTQAGVILDFVLAPANVPELQAGVELLEEHADLAAPGDKAFVSRPAAERLRAENRVALLTLPRRNQRRQPPAARRRLLSRARQVIETVNGQLAEQFKIAVNHALSFAGLTARLYTKLTAHVACVYLNRLAGAPDVLQLKALAFPRPN